MLHSLQSSENEASTKPRAVRQLDLMQMESTPFIRALEELVRERDCDVSPSELLRKLGGLASVDELGDPAWPKSVKQLSQDLERLAPVLRRHGIEVSRYKTSGSNSKRMNRIRRTNRAPSSST